MKISILLPYKENFSPDYPGAVSIFIKGVNTYSKFKNKIKVFGSTKLLKKYSTNYVNIPLKKKYFQSSTKIYLKNFLEKEKKRKSSIIEIHNRPEYVQVLSELKNRKFVLYFHNDPLSMTGSVSKKERIYKS